MISPLQSLLMVPTSPVMQPTSSSVRSSRTDRLSISIVPDWSLNAEPILSCSPCLFGQDAKCSYSSRLVDADSLQGQQSCTSLTKVETAIMSEVADWWQSQYVDEFWAPRNKQQRRVCVPAPSRADTSLMRTDTTYCQPDPTTSQKLEITVRRIINRG